MRSVREATWERALARYFTIHSIPLKWDGVAKRFLGIRGLMISRINPQVEESAWAEMPKRIRAYEAKDRNPDRLNAIVLVTNKRYGDSIDDTMVVMRLGTLLPMLKSYTKEGNSNASINPR